MYQEGNPLQTLLFTVKHHKFCNFMYKFIALVKFYVDYLGLVFLLNSIATVSQPISTNGDFEEIVSSNAFSILGVEVSSLNLRH